MILIKSWTYVKKVCNTKKFLKNFFDHFWLIISHTEYHQFGKLDFLISISGLVGPRTHFFLVGRYFIEFSLWICSSLTFTPPARCSGVQYFLCCNILLDPRREALIPYHHISKSRLKLPLLVSFDDVKRLCIIENTSEQLKRLKKKEKKEEKDGSE